MLMLLLLVMVMWMASVGQMIIACSAALHARRWGLWLLLLLGRRCLFANYVIVNQRLMRSRRLFVIIVRLPANDLPQRVLLLLMLMVVLLLLDDMDRLTSI